MSFSQESPRDAVVLFVCTANRCRSPMAEALMRAAARDRGAHVEVQSAGLHPAGQPVDPKAVRAVSRHDVELSGYRSRQLTRQDLDRAALVLTMERRHVLAAVDLQPDVWPRCFTLKDLLARSEERGDRHPDDDVATWVRRLHKGRRPTDVLSGDSVMDVADPVGLSPRAFRRTADELKMATATLADLLNAAPPVTIVLPSDSPKRRLTSAWRR